jgi:transposase
MNTCSAGFLETKSYSPKTLVNALVLLRGQGLSQQEVAARLSVERVVVSKWENRFRKEGLAGLEERRRSGRPPVVAQSTKASILDHVEWLAFLKQIDRDDNPKRCVWKAA